MDYTNQPEVYTGTHDMDYTNQPEVYTGTNDMDYTNQPEVYTGTHEEYDAVSNRSSLEHFYL
jgi:hypothetical protein